jgi:hypothetical protein
MYHYQLKILRAITMFFLSMCGRFLVQIRGTRLVAMTEVHYFVWPLQGKKGVKKEKTN